MYGDQSQGAAYHGKGSRMSSIARGLGARCENLLLGTCCIRIWHWQLSLQPRGFPQIDSLLHRDLLGAVSRYWARGRARPIKLHACVCLSQCTQSEILTLRKAWKSWRCLHWFPSVFFVRGYQSCSDKRSGSCSQWSLPLQAFLVLMEAKWDR